MEAFTTLTAIAAPIDQPNVDTDQITPSRFLKKWEGADWATIMFHDLRFNPDGSEKPDFILNRPPYRDARILVADRNFACGSSRESAVLALFAYGFRAVIAPSFGDIFFNNAGKNGLLTFTLDGETCARLRQQLHEEPGAEIGIDLASQTMRGPDGATYRFEIDAFRKHAMLHGLDDIDFTLESEAEIDAHEARHREEMSWLQR